MEQKINTVESAELPGSQWRDPKRHLWLFSLLVPVLPFLGGAAALASGMDLFWYASPIYVYCLVPMLDWWLGEDADNPPESMLLVLQADPYYQRIVMAFIPLQYALLITGIWAISGLELSLFATLGLVYSMALSAGGGINAAHELGHKRGALAGWLAKLALAPSGYGHFYVEHNRGHHVRVATPEDPASARYGEGFHQFWCRCVSGSIASAWQLEKTRLLGANHSIWSPSNHCLQGWALTALLFGLLCIAFGVAVLPWLLVQMVLGFTLLELVNYIEHYGLLRQIEASGRYERPQPKHSWNSNHLVSNLVLYQLQRHSDHHAHASRSFQALRHRQSAPQLPAGYAVMILLASIPPLWRKVMDPRVRAHYRGDLARANLQSRTLNRY